MRALHKLGRVIAKGLGWPDFYGYDSQSSGAYIDKWGKQRTPNYAQLLNEYKGCAYACVNLNTQGILKSRLRLYQKATSGQKLLYPTRALSTWQSKSLSARNDIRVSDQQRLVEITEHPILRLLFNPNPMIDAHTLMELTALYMDICGAAYWYTPKNGLDKPGAVYLLMPQYVTPILHEDTGWPVEYEYGVGETKQTYAVDEIIPWLVPDPSNPWIKGRSPLMSVYEQASVEDKYIATESAMLDNEARPAMMGSFKDGIDPKQAERLEHKFNNKLRRAGAGGLVLMPEDMSLTPISYSPRDLARLEVHEHTKISICNAYGVPFPLLADSSGSQYNVHTTLMLQHVEDAIAPRLNRNQSILNQYLVSKFDSSGNLFLAYDDPSPRNRELELEEQTKLVAASIMVPNEARIARGLEPTEWGDKPAGQYTAASQTTQGADGSVTSLPETTDISGDEDLTGTAPAPEETSPFATSEPMGDIGDVLDIVSSLMAHKITNDQAVRLVMHTLHVEEDEARKIVGGYDPQLPDPDDKPEAIAQPPKADDTEDSKKKSYEVDPAHGKALPEGTELEKVLKTFFADQEAHIVASLGHTKAINEHLPTQFVPLSSWDRTLYTKSQPLIELYIKKGYEGEADQLVQRTGISDDVFNVTSPELKKAAHDATYDFCQATNETTTLELNEALDKLRTEFTEGLLQGERMHELTRRVQGVFTNAEQYRAERIARTESSRAHHEGLRRAAIDSGVVSGFELLLSSNACPLCKEVKAKNGSIGLNGHFYEDASAPPAYQRAFLPIHPHCRCSCTEILDIQSELNDSPDDTTD